jgi:hypothetical protein
MSNYALRLVVEKIDLKNENSIIKRDELSTIEIKNPNTILELGLRHSEQIEFLKRLQDKVLSEQSVFLKTDIKKCLDCQSELCSNGYHASKFHSIFTDHDIKLQRKKCTNKDCGSSVVPSVKSHFGTSIHPDLYRLQCEQGAEHSYRKAENILDTMSNKKRSINNHERVKTITNQVGEVLSDNNKNYNEYENPTPAKEMIIQVDGGHIKSKDLEKRSFEAMSAKIYRPESVIEITETRSEITDRICVASAKDDRQSSMKAYVLMAAKCQGLTKETQVIGLADGAKNCWGILRSVEKHSASLLCILDWFHIAKKFEPVKRCMGERSKLLDEIKNLVWKGNIELALNDLQTLKTKTVDAKEKSKINGIYIYLKRNKEQIINYNERAKNNSIYTSQVAESTVEHLINDRHKRNQKMQWTREGAHNVLQIRAAIASNRWDSSWQDTVFEAIRRAA